MSKYYLYLPKLKHYKENFSLKLHLKETSSLYSIESNKTLC